jgi:hypothetical protein
MITPNPHHPDRNRVFAGLIVGVALGSLIWVVIISVIVAAVRYAV